MSRKSNLKRPQIINAAEAFARGQDSFYGSRRRRRSFKNAYPMLFVAAKAGIPHAQNLVGFCLDEGKGITRNRRAARHWYAKAARAGHVIATVNLAMSYASGIGGSRSLKRAAELYQTAAKTGGLGAVQPRRDVFRWQRGQAGPPRRSSMDPRCRPTG